MGKLYEELISINRETTERRNALNADAENARKRGTQVTVIVLADSPGLAHLRRYTCMVDAAL